MFVKNFQKAAAPYPKNLVRQFRRQIAIRSTPGFLINFPFEDAELFTQYEAWKKKQKPLPESITNALNID